MPRDRHERDKRQEAEAVVADGGPANKLGEISLACAKAIGVPVNENSAHPANSGGIAATSHVIHYRLFPGVAASLNGVTYPLQPDPDLPKMRVSCLSPQRHCRGETMQ
jgi:hypothetical protein